MQFERLSEAVGSLHSCSQLVNQCAVSFGDLSPHDDASSSYAVDSLAGHIFPEVQQSSLYPIDDAGGGSLRTDRGQAAASIRSRDISNSMSRGTRPNSHPIRVTGEDIEHSLSELDLGLFSPSVESAGPSFGQAAQAPTQSQSAGIKPTSKRPSFSSASAGKTGQQQHTRDVPRHLLVHVRRLFCHFLGRSTGQGTAPCLE